MRTQDHNQLEQELPHEIELNQAILQSLKERPQDDDTAAQISAVTELIHHYEEQLRNLQYLPRWGNSVPQRDSSRQATIDAANCGASGSPSDIERPESKLSFRHSSTEQADDAVRSMQRPEGFQNHLRPPHMRLPTRKRAREGSVDEDASHDAKSLRPSPSPAISAAGASTPTSTADSIDFDFEDESLRTLLGDDVGDLAELIKEQRRFEKQRELEQKDEELARSLSQPLSILGPPQPAARSQQAILNRNGSFAMPPPLAPILRTEKSTCSTPMPGAFPIYSRSGPGSPSSTDSSDFEEIPASAFSPRIARPSFEARSQAVPGQYPVGGSSVCGSPSYTFRGTYNPALSFLDDQIAGYGDTAPGFGALHSYGSAGWPLALAGDDSALEQPSTYQDYRELIHDPKATEEELKMLLKHIRPDEELLDHENTPKQLAIDLYPHQVLGLTWMKQMEAGTNKGGILADDMGLGKTIQALSLILSHPSEDLLRKVTLVVAPLALMQQWKREIEKLVKPKYALKVLILHADTRDTRWSALRQQDVVLTTFGTLASELKRKQAWDMKVKQYQNVVPTAKDHLPLLGDESKWYRVILDESQHIKNKATRTAIAAGYLQSTYRWCMSGTPLQNNVEELYSQIRFLRIKPYNSADRFSREFTRPLKRSNEADRTRAMQQFQVLLKAILLRRTKMSKINGAPILQLPPKTTEVHHAVFSHDESEFYKALENATQLTFNKYLKAGTIGRQYSNVLVLLLRLRQACCHPHLIRDFAIDTGAPADIDLLVNARALPANVVERLRQVDAFECPVCFDAALNPVIFVCGHTLCTDCMSRVRDEALANRGDDGRPEIKCPHCRAKVDPSRVTDYVSFKKVQDGKDEFVDPDDDETATDSDTSDAETGEDDDENGDLKDFVVPDDDIEYKSDSDIEQDYREGETPFQKSKKERTRNKHRKSKTKGKEKVLKKEHKSLAQLRTEGLRNKAAKRKYIRQLQKDWITSAKIDKTLELLETIHAHGVADRKGQERVIIFSAFTSLLDLLEVAISRKPEFGDYTRYDGSMRTQERTDAVIKFTDNPRCTIMLVSLKAGNSGLNLVAASQVIILDPHWNGFVEAQAVDRSHRIGQRRPVRVHRILVEGTVEDRILALQEKKRELVETALDESAAQSVSRLGIRELGYLFGVNSLD